MTSCTSAHHLLRNMPGYHEWGDAATLRKAKTKCELRTCLSKFFKALLPPALTFKNGTDVLEVNS